VPVLREVRALHGMRAAILPSASVPGLTAQEATFGIHAGEVETSWILAAAGALADPSRAVCEYPARIEDPGSVRPVAAPALQAWASRDVSKSGTMGDAASATAQKGERWLELGATAYAQAISEACRAARRP
jgi:creatinine amidohydrolase